MAPGATYRDTTTARVPASAAPGFYRFIACADDRDRVRRDRAGNRDRNKIERTGMNLCK